jgi:hypothetical protein
MRGWAMKLKPFDILAVALSAAVAAASAVLVYGGGEGDAKVIVEGGGKTWVFPLDAEETLSVRGEIGDTVVHIHDGKVAVEASPCENQTCVAAGSIDSNGQWVACLPNAVFVRVEGSSKHEALDATIR